MSVLPASVRPLRAVIVVMLIVAGGIGLGAKPARAAGTGVFLACGYANQTGAAPRASNCTSLSDALTAAAASASQSGKAVRVDLMPGLYCPVTLPAVSPGITLIGIGAAGTASGTSTHVGPEAELSSFVWQTVTCPTLPTSDVTTAAGAGSLTLANLAVSGVSGGPGNGIALGGTVTTLRDVLVENFVSGTGLSGSAMHLENSAINGNQNGISVSGASSIDQSTLADNTADGLDLSGSGIAVVNDTIAHNANGINVLSSGQPIKMANTIVGDNTTADCTGTVADLDPGAANGQGTNLVGATCNTGDKSLGATTVNSTFRADGPTPSITPPTLAETGAGRSDCGSTGSDQREFITTVKTNSTCDIGSVNLGTNGVAHPATRPGSLNFGLIPIHQTSTRSIALSNSGGGLMGVTTASIKGRGYSIPANNCALTMVVHSVVASCTVTVEARLGTAKLSNGSLTIHTTGGTITVKLTARTGDHSTLRSAPVVHVTYGAAITLSTRLTDTRTHTPLKGVRVTLLSRTAGTRAPYSPHVTKTNSRGVARVKVQPAANKQYEWSFNGTSGHARITTPASTVFVRQLVTARLGRSKDHHGKPARILGTVAPQEAGRRVVLQRLVAGKWQSLGITAKIKRQRTSSHKNVTAFALTYRPARAGRETLRVFRAATSSNAAGLSKELHLRVT
jgi:hypothetical protein